MARQLAQIRGAVARLATSPAARPGVVHGLATIRILDPYGSGMYDDLIDAFYARYSSIRALVVALPETPASPNYMSALVSALGQGAFDVLPYPPLPALTGPGLLLDLARYIQGSALDPRPFGGLIPQMEQHGHLFALPVGMDGPVLLYNEAFFGNSAMPPPAAGWTWPQMASLARQVTHGAGSGKVWGLFSAHPENLVADWLAQTTGGNIASATAGQLETALAFFWKMITVDQSMAPAPPQVANAKPIVSGPLFNDGLAAMTDNSLGQMASTAPRNGSVRWNVVPIPGQPGTRKQLQVTVYAFSISAGTAAPDAAWDFLAFAAARADQKVLHLGTTPAYRSPAAVAAWMATLGKAPPAGVEALFQLPPVLLGYEYPGSQGLQTLPASFQSAAAAALSGTAAALPAAIGAASALDGGTGA